MFDKQWDIKLNWAWILLLAFLWDYGIYGACTLPGLFGDLALCALFYLMLLGLFRLTKGAKAFEDRLKVTSQDLMVLGSYFLLLLAITWQELALPLVGDEISHSLHSQIFAIGALQLLMNKPIVMRHLGRVPFKLILAGMNWLLLAILSVGILFFRRLGRRGQLVALTLVFFAFRALVYKLGLDFDPHPPLRLFPLWLVSSLAPISDMAFKLPQLAGLAMVMIYLYRALRRHTTVMISWWGGLALGTFPLMLHVGTLVEQSIWATLAGVLILIGILDGESPDEIPWVRLFSLTCVLFLMRESAISGFVVLGMFWLYVHGLKSLEPKRWAILAPILVAVPFAIRSIVLGTPATYIEGESALIPAHVSSLMRVAIAFRSGIAWQALRNALSPVALALVLPGTLPFRRLHRSRLWEAGILIFYLFLGVYLFYTIRPVLWGVGRYHAEFVMPFVAFGLFQLLVWASKILKTQATWLLTSVLAILVVWNVWGYYRLPSINPPVDEIISQDIPLYSLTVLSRLPYDFHHALQAAKQTGFADATYIVGSSFGNLPEILSGYTLRDIKADLALNKDMQRYEDTPRYRSADVIDADPAIRLVLLVGYPKSPELQQALIKRGWHLWRKFKDERYRSTIVGLCRSGTY